MPRKNRQETVGSQTIHHIVQRSVNRCEIFRAESDYEYFKSMVRRYIERHALRLYNYCIMPDHVHLLLYVDTPEALSKFIQSLSLAYSSYYRTAYSYSGYLWQGRYKNFPVGGGEYLLECARYIERNPLRLAERNAADISDYKWSSYNFYAHGAPDDIVTENPLFGTIGGTDEERRIKYREYVLAPRFYEGVYAKGY